MPSTVTDKAARLICDFDGAAVPPAALDAAAVAIRDCVGVALAGFDEPVSRIVRDMDPALHAEITATCRHVAAMMGMSGYCRFDLRQDPDGRINIIDINANPDIGPGSGFRKALAAADIGFGDFLAELISARLRGRRESWRSAA